jgi:hypothetical protein
MLSIKKKDIIVLSIPKEIHIMVHVVAGIQNPKRSIRDEKANNKVK